MSLTFTDWVKSPPGFDLTSSTYPSSLLSNSSFIDFIDFIKPDSVCSVKDVILRYPTFFIISYFTD